MSELMVAIICRDDVTYYSVDLRDLEHVVDVFHFGSMCSSDIYSNRYFSTVYDLMLVGF